MSSRSLASKLSRFGIVGVANSLVDLAVFSLLVAAGILPLAANVLAWLVAVTFSYAVNSRWSFERGHGAEGRSIAAFVTLNALIALGVSSGAILLLADIVGLFPAKLLGMVVAAGLSFLAARWSIETLSRRSVARPGSEDEARNPSAADPQPPRPPER